MCIPTIIFCLEPSFKGDTCSKLACMYKFKEWLKEGSFIVKNEKVGLSAQMICAQYGDNPFFCMICREKTFNFT